MALETDSLPQVTPPPAYEPFVDEQAGAVFLDVSVRTLQRWRSEPPTGGGPPFYRFGGRITYRLSGLSNWAEQKKFFSTSAADVAASSSRREALALAARKLGAPYKKSGS